MPQLTEIRTCEVCGAGTLSSVLDLGAHPMCDDLVSVGQDRVCTEYPIEILYCERCQTAHQRFQIAKRELFPANYHYRSRHTQDVLNGMRLLVEACRAETGDLRGALVLDVGCNDGSLLSIFAQHGARCHGIEPTDAAQDARMAGHAVVNDYLSEDMAERFVAQHGHPAIVTFTNVFAHIEDLTGVLRALKTLAAPHTLIVIENHYLGSILAKHQFDTFYHEHPRTYTYTSFVFIAQTLGMKVARLDFPQRYGGNIRVFLRDAAHRGDVTDHSALLSLESQYGDNLARLSRSMERWRDVKATQIGAAVKRHGALRAKAFPGRAAIPIKMLDLDFNAIEAVFEKPGSAKIGHYVPGTRIPILSDDDFASRGREPPPLMNMAWHISEEIQTYLRRRGYAGEIIDIISAADFAE